MDYDGRKRTGRWDGELVLSGAGLKTPATGDSSLVSGDVALRSVEPPTLGARGRKAAVSPDGSSFQLEPVSLELGAREPAVLDGYVDGTGYTLHLTGMATLDRLQEMAQAVPQLGEGLLDALPRVHDPRLLRFILTATRQWGGTQVWHDNTAAPPVRGRRRR